MFVIVEVMGGFRRPCGISCNVEKSTRLNGNLLTRFLQMTNSCCFIGVSFTVHPHVSRNLEPLKMLPFAVGKKSSDRRDDSPGEEIISGACPWTYTPSLASPVIFHLDAPLGLGS